MRTSRRSRLPTIHAFPKMQPDILGDPLTKAVNLIGDGLYKERLPKQREELAALLRPFLGRVIEQTSKAFDTKSLQRHIKRGALSPGDQRLVASTLRQSQSLGKPLQRITRDLARALLTFLMTVAEETLITVILRSAEVIQANTPDHAQITATVSSEERRLARNIMVGGQPLRAHVSALLSDLPGRVRATCVSQINAQPTVAGAKAEAVRALEGRWTTLERALTRLLTETVSAVDALAQGIVNAPAVILR